MRTFQNISGSQDAVFQAYWMMRNAMDAEEGSRQNEYAYKHWGDCHEAMRAFVLNTPATTADGVAVQLAEGMGQLYGLLDYADEDTSAAMHALARVMASALDFIVTTTSRPAQELLGFDHRKTSVYPWRGREVEVPERCLSEEVDKSRGGDKALIALGTDLRQLRGYEKELSDHIKAAEPGSAEEKRLSELCDEAGDEISSVLSAIEHIPARSREGQMVKAFAVLCCHGSDRISIDPKSTTDVRMAFSLAQDMLDHDEARQEQESQAA